MKDRLNFNGRNQESRIWVVGLLFFLLVGTLPATAQLPTATILGVVKDSSGAVVAGAALTARNVATGQTRTTVTAGDGSYRFSALPVGNYEVRLEHPGFQSAVRSGLTLTVAQEVVLNFMLQVGAIEQTVSVTAEAPLVNTTSGSLGGLVNEQSMADLPLNGRNYIDLTLLQTGVVQHRNIGSAPSTIGKWFSSNGAPLRSNNYLLDGASMVSLAGGTSASISNSTLGVEGIREFRVVTNSFSAEYGMAMGSQMLVVSKSGTNDFHGTLFEYLRLSALDARNFFDRQTASTPRRLPAFTRNNFGASFGGPIRKDKTFFYGVYEAIRERLGRTTLTDVIPPSAKVDGGLVPQIAPVIKPLLALYPDPNLPNNQYTFPFSQPTTENYGQIRADQTVSVNDSLFGRYTIQDAQVIRPLAYPQFIEDGATRGQYATVSENHIFSPTLLNTFRFSFSRFRLLQNSPSGIIGPQFSFVPGLEIGGISIGGVSGLGPNGNTPIHYKQNIVTWSDDLFYTRGRHSLKFGSLINRYRQYMLVSSAGRGSVSFTDLRSFLLAQPTNYNAVTPGSILDRTYHFTTLGFYAQDDLRLAPSVTLNLGLRYEFHTEYEDPQGHTANLRDIQHDANTTIGPPFANPSRKNVSPRFGFAWDVRGNGKTAVRGGFGLLYDIANYGSALIQVTTAMPPFSSQSRLVSTPTSPLSLVLPFTFPASAAGKLLRPVEYHLQQPHILQYNLTMERQLPWQMALTLAYGGSRGINLMQVKEGNPTVPQTLPDGRRFWPVNAPRTNPNWADFSLYTAGASSWYNSLQFGLLKRLSKGWQFQSSYTWSKLIDETQGQFNVEAGGGGTSFGADPTHREVDRGLAAFDSAHNWRFNTIYRLPEFVSGGVPGKLVNGWWLSGILSLQTGYPFTPALTNNRSRSGVNGGGAGIDRPDLVAGRSNDNLIRGGPDRYFDPGAFTIPAAGFLGNLGRNTLRGPGFATLDFSLAKDTPLAFLGESGKLEFRAEFFNLLNRANFATPDRTVFAARADVEPPLATAGRITSTGSSTSRQIQFALKLLF